MYFYVKKLEVNALGLEYILTKANKESVVVSYARPDSFLVSLSKGTLQDKDCQDEYSRISIKILERYEDSPILEPGEGPGDILKVIIQNQNTKIRAILFKSESRLHPRLVVASSDVIDHGHDIDYYCNILSEVNNYAWEYVLVFLTNGTVLKLGQNSTWLTYVKEFSTGVDELLTYIESL